MWVEIVIMIAVLTTLSLLMSLPRGEFIYCEDIGSCVNESITVSCLEWSQATKIYCEGLGSCFKSSLIHNHVNPSLGGATQCHGKRSCQNAQFLTGNAVYSADIRGYLGLAWSEKVFNLSNSNGWGHLGCFGEASCYKIKMISYVIKVQARGHMSVAYVDKIANVDDIQGWGMFGMTNSFIYNDNKNTSNEITATMYGFYSGYNTTIYCGTGHNCSVVCQTNGCENLNFICGNYYDNYLNGSSNTTGIANAHAGICVVSCNETEGIICPNGWQNGINNYTIGIDSNYSYNYNYLSLLQVLSNITSGLEKYFRVSALKQDYIELPNSNINSSLYDIVANFDFECENNSMNHNLSLCTDYSQCENQKIEFTNNSDENICCSGDSSCNSATIVSNMNSLIESHDVYCDGDYSCRAANITLSVSNKDNVYCRARYACLYVKLGPNFNNAICSGERSCYKSSLINNGNVVGCFGYESCAQGNIFNVKYIIATSYLGLFNTTISSDGINIDVYLLGYQSGKELSIICGDGDECTLYCITRQVCEAVDSFSCKNSPTSCYLNTVYLNASVPSVAPTATPTAALTTEPSKQDSVGEVDIVINPMSSNTTTNTIYLNDSRIASQIVAKFTILFSNDDNIDNDTEGNIKYLSSTINILFKDFMQDKINRIKYPKNNTQELAVDVNTTVEIVYTGTDSITTNDNNNNNNNTNKTISSMGNIRRRFLLQFLTTGDNTNDGEEEEEESENDNGELTIQVETIIIIENEIINSENSSYFSNITDVFYDILQATQNIFNTTDVFIDNINIFVSITTITDEQDKTVDDNSYDNKKFWTPEMIAVLSMIVVGLCIVSSVLFCCITFCCKKRKESHESRKNSRLAGLELQSASQSD